MPLEFRTCVWGVPSAVSRSALIVRLAQVKVLLMLLSQQRELPSAVRENEKALPCSVKQEQKQEQESAQELQQQRVSKSLFISFHSISRAAPWVTIAIPSDTLHLNFTLKSQI